MLCSDPSSSGPPSDGVGSLPHSPHCAQGTGHGFLEAILTTFTELWSSVVSTDIYEPDNSKSLTHRELPQGQAKPSPSDSHLSTQPWGAFLSQPGFPITPRRSSGSISLVKNLSTNLCLLIITWLLIIRTSSGGPNWKKTFSKVTSHALLCPHNGSLPFLFNSD